MVDFRRIIYKTDKGYIAVIDRASAESEKAEIAEFSDATKRVLGLGGWYEVHPLIKPYSWNDYPDDPRPRNTHVFVMVIDDEIIGYLVVRWHYHISRHGLTLDARGHPLEENHQAPAKGGSKVAVLTRIKASPPMNFWGIDGICILPEYQRRGLGTLLLHQGLRYLKTGIREIAWDPPFTRASEALLRSLGLDPKEARLSSSE